MQLVADSLRISRGGRIVIDALSLTVREGQALVVTGPNGAGKTTLLRALGGLATLEVGTVRLAGGNDELSVGEQSHYVGHRDAVKGGLSVGENAGFWARYLGGSTALVGQALAQLGLAELSDIPAAYLSAGQRRRLGLARLLLAERPVWLLDEPTVSLDAASVEALTEMVRAHLSNRGLVVAATHVRLGFGDGAGELRLGVPAGVVA